MTIRKLTTKAYQQLTNNEGQGLLEYVLLTSLIAIALISSLVLLQSTLIDFFTNLSIWG